MSSCLETKLSFEKINSEKATYPAIILAAGSATRMNGIDKISYPLSGRPVLLHSVSAFLNNKHICELVVVTTKEKCAEYLSLIESLGSDKPIKVTEGAKCREESVLLGIKALGGRYKKALVHDAARPLVNDAVINNVCELLCLHDSVVAAVKTKDTIKTVNEDGMVVRTLNRDALVNVQTPQGVNIELFLRAAEKFSLDRFTDDTSVVEAVGAKTYTVSGDYKNIKITTPEDILIAEAYLKGEAL